MQYLGNEQEGSGLFVRFINPSDATALGYKLNDIIKDYYPGIDWLNPTLWSLLGAEKGSKTIPFIERLAFIQRQRNESLNASNKAAFIDSLVAKYSDYKREHVEVYVRAYLDALSAGIVPDTISKPWTYTPETIGESIAGIGMKQTNKILALTVGVAIVYLLGKEVIKRKL